MTVESYWPYATTLFDYVRRAMPFQAPGSLNADEVYAVSAYILAEGNIIDKTTVLDAETSRRYKIPNREGFIPDARREKNLRVTMKQTQDHAGIGGRVSRKKASAEGSARSYQNALSRYAVLHHAARADRTGSIRRH